MNKNQGINNINDLYKLNIDDLRSLVRSQVIQANQQIKELEESGYAPISQAYRSLSSKQGREHPSFSLDVDNLSKPMLIHKYVSTTNFLTLKTSSVIGTRETNINVYQMMGYTREQAEEIVEKQVEGDYTINYKKTIPQVDGTIKTIEGSFDVRKKWSLYRKFEESDEGQKWINKYGSSEIQAKIDEYMVTNSSGDVDIDLSNLDAWFKNVEESMETLEQKKEEEENRRLWGKKIEDD